MERFEHRVAMCHLCMDDESTTKCKVRVMEIEKYAAEYYAKKEGPEFRVGTVNVLDYIFEMVPGIVLQLVLGTDTYKDLITRKWKQADRILKMVTVHAISRLGIETTGVEISTDKCLISINAAKKGMEGENGEREDVNVKVVHHKVPWLTEVSSSLVRRISASIGIDLSCLVNKKEIEELSPSEGDAAMKDLLDDRVLKYIKQHHLYGYGQGPADTNSVCAASANNATGKITTDCSNGSNNGSSKAEICTSDNEAPVVVEVAAATAAVTKTTVAVEDKLCGKTKHQLQEQAVDVIITGTPTKRLRVGV
eukprot:CAMPEP_0170412896 /NCGR_PEP_ID=MMETSP0117_2-20130122/31225_1 /TAXON_ID=400756 /ORGANISM="Durinskia baltica, Strain CSIRO CS-38" /LENGTH=307 /DNA_ID=CAMNT_0010670641 /DNA_START=270 /DNA_END=1193 /DNA_ORIENTATION=-